MAFSIPSWGLAQATFSTPTFQSQNSALATPAPTATPTTFQTPGPTDTYQYPATNQPGTPTTAGTPMYGQTQAPAYSFQSPPLGQPAPQQAPPGIAPGQPYFAPPGSAGQPGANQQFAQPVIPSQPGVLDLDVTVPQAKTQRFSIGGTYGSDNGIVGQFIFDEKDFDILNGPLRARDTFGRYAWKGGGQHLRAEAVPGQDVNRYLISWSNPYFLNTNYSLSVSGYLFDRRFVDYDEQRAGGRVGLGRELTDYLSLNMGLRMESVTIDNPRVPTSNQLNETLGNSNLFLGSIGLVYDTRVHPYLTGTGSYLGMKFTQAFGDYSYSRGDVDFRTHRTIYERVDGSGRHTLGFRSNLGITSLSTPVFENYIAGGMTSLRGFEFRGVSPIEGDVRVGGAFQWLNSIEYDFPLTQGDMIHGVMFCDFGTVEEEITINSSNFRVAPGLGLRVHLPYSGLGAPLAFDFTYPVSTADGDQEQNYGFLIGITR